LTDVVLPGMNGHELAQNVIRLCPSIKIGFITGWFDEQVVKLGMCGDCGCVLRKPFAISELVRFVHEICRRDTCAGLTYDAVRSRPVDIAPVSALQRQSERGA
jgi:DNA-binding response OmpR family regulator